MNIVTDLQEWLAIRNTLQHKSIGFVPTMGNLHAGHLSLCERAAAENDITVVSIFVNPTQFNETNDFANYPRTLLEDQESLAKFNIDYLLLPTQESMYADQYEIQVNETSLSQILEGEFRPGHFSGMLTVVLKLLNLVAPQHAYFGEKDYQQFLLIQKMVGALFLPVKIIGCETVRARDGLALSSRNSRLNEVARERAAAFPRLLSSDLTVSEIMNELAKLEFKVEYIAEKWGRRLGAVWLDGVRLIDNVAI